MQLSSRNRAMLQECDMRIKSRVKQNRTATSIFSLSVFREQQL